MDRLDIYQAPDGAIGMMDVHRSLYDPCAAHGDLKINDMIRDKVRTERGLINPALGYVEAVGVRNICCKGIMVTTGLGACRPHHQHNRRVHKRRAAVCEL